MLINFRKAKEQQQQQQQQKIRKIKMGTKQEQVFNKLNIKRLKQKTKKKFKR